MTEFKQFIYQEKFYNTNYPHVKGAIISEQNCGVLNFPKKQQNYCKPLEWVKFKEMALLLYQMVYNH